MRNQGGNTRQFAFVPCGTGAFCLHKKGRFAMKEKIAQIQELLRNELSSCESMQALDALRVKVLG